ncbi:M48 family metallopeptidase [Gorillibacterium sp. sgz5001074]|uniref:M48 family metallopeptidase n=1 Tax=Gorillibacterium sp. sgz5001074 TaxID=3446695 RepID=UPI003F665577
MPSNRYIRRYLVFFLLYAAAMGLYLWLTRANTVPAPYKGGPADPATFMNARELRVSEVYSAQRNWLFFIAYPWEWGIYILLLFSGWAKRLEAAMERRGLPGLLRYPLFAGAVNAIAFFSYLPVRYIGYRLSLANGISTQTLPGWLRDKLVGFGTDTVILAVVTTVAFWFIRRGGRWWLKLWLLSVPFTLFMMYIQPVVLDPLYNQFTRLSDPVLESKILTLADQAGVPADRVYEADMSRKTNALNAYVNGIGSSLRIVLWDTLFRLEQREILLIVAHEIGHYTMHHLEWSAFGAIVSSFFLLLVGQAALVWVIKRWGRHWGIDRVSRASAVPVVLLVLSLITFITLPVSNAVSRRAEAAADDYAMRLIGSAEGAVSMNQKLAKTTYDDVDPPLLVLWFRSTHPSAMERILAADAFDTRAKRP